MHDIRHAQFLFQNASLYMIFNYGNPVSNKHTFSLFLQKCMCAHTQGWQMKNKIALKDLSIHYCHLQCPPKKKWPAAVIPWVNGGRSFQCVYLPSIFSHNMLAASIVHLILVQPCHGILLSLSLWVSVPSQLALWKKGKKQLPGWPFPYFQSMLFYSGLLSSWYGVHSVIWNVGKRMEGAFVPLWEQAGGNGPLRFTQTLRKINASRHRFVRVIDQCCSFNMMGVFALDMGRWPWSRESCIHLMYSCKGGVGTEKLEKSRFLCQV